MKKILIVSLFTLSLFSLSGCGKDTSADYNEKLVNLVEKCTTAEDLMRDAIDQESYTTAQTLHATATETCKDAQADTAKLEGFDNDTSLRDTSNNYLQTEVAYLEKLEAIFAYQDLAEFTPAQETSYLTLESELSSLADATTNAYTELTAVQKTFADAHGYQLETL
ncbi:MAG: hypothetical protein LBD11_05930 [Candidatus Peribacteria bacterium]|jgi:hypothetical protein|nr:hypothetical protein [Candidatus Peribacteria bacterium]